MMVLYSGTTCPFSHRCRFVLFEKGMDFEIRDVDLYNKPEDINVMNPYGQVPSVTSFCTSPTSSMNTLTSASRIRS
jgi:glutathione S-transferase